MNQARTIAPAAAAALGLVLLLGCERPLADYGESTFTILSPDLSEVLTRHRVRFRVAVRSVGAVSAVRMNSLPLELSANGNHWEITYVLRRGLNLLVLDATTEQGTTDIDSVYAMHMPFGISLNAPALPEGRGGHTATFTVAGDILVAGGSARRGGRASADAFALVRGGRAFETLPQGLHAARTGHTATRLADGRVLFLGGSTTDNVQYVTELVETAELYDPAADSFAVVPVIGQPIRRTLHSAMLRDVDSGVYVDLYGGRGDTRYIPESFLGVRRDLRTFEFARDSLFALHTLASAPYLDAAVYGHSVTRLHADTYVVLGGSSSRGLSNESDFLLEYNASGNLRTSRLPAMTSPRTQHAASLVLGNFVIAFGGREVLDQDIVTGQEVFSSVADRFFVLPLLQAGVRRYGHKAVPVSQQLVLLVGGFGVDGTAYAASEFFAVLE